MTLVKGPNGRIWDLDPVVASGLLGSPSGDYQQAEGDEPAVEAPTPNDMTVKELKAYAAEQGIDLGDAKKKQDILAVIHAAEELSDQGPEPEGADSDDSDED